MCIYIYIYIYTHTYPPLAAAQAMGQMMSGSETILKLGFECQELCVYIYIYRYIYLIDTHVKLMLTCNIYVFHRRGRDCILVAVLDCTSRFMFLQFIPFTLFTMICIGHTIVHKILLQLYLFTLFTIAQTPTVFTYYVVVWV